MAAVLVLGVGWYTVRALNTVAPSASDREVKTGLALQDAKRALLAYVAQYAGRSTTTEPGQMPCPEALTLSNPGETYGSCSATAILVGRLPWKTLGIDPIYDGYGEPLWYMTRGLRDPPINFGTAGQLTYNGSSVVAMIIAPGRPLNTLADPGTPPAGCAKVNQAVATRNSATLSASNFLECGLATGSIAAPGNSTWTNDRVIAVTAAEWIAAIAGPVADRLQREVAPALAEWRSTESNSNWSASFLPAASTFSNPATNSLCGTYAEREGLMPVARSASSTCTSWTNGTVTQLPLLGLIGGVGCAAAGSNYECQYTQTLGILGIGSARIRARAPNVGQSFRNRISAASIVVNPPAGTVTNFTLTLDPATGDALIDFRVEFFLALLSPVTVRIPNLPDAALFADARMAWFVDNDWARYTYYSIAPGSQLNAASGCAAPGDADCMTFSGLPASNGNPDDKRFILALMGPALATQLQPSASSNQYIESRTDSMTYHQDRLDAVFNDRLATCPFQQTPLTGTPLSICN